MSKIIYFCDGEDDCCDSPSCYSDCFHTSNIEHTKYGVCDDPQNHPKRFEHITRKDGEDIYWEKTYETNPNDRA